MKLYYIVILIIFVACGKSDTPSAYTVGNTTTNNPNDTKPDPNSIVGLHTNIFKPTCANSGCHDGTFEPDYRTVESTYNSLVYAGIVKNTANNDYTYRVLPGDASKSMLYYRITENLGGNSGVMPLSTDPGSDYPPNKEKYIQNIKTWINNGAKDQFDKAPILPNPEPQIAGTVAYISGTSTMLSRPSQLDPIVVPNGTSSIDVYFSLIDDKTPQNQLKYNKIKLSDSLDGFSSKAEMAFQLLSNPLITKGVGGSNVPYVHKITISTSNLKINKTYFLRSYTLDADHTVPKEIPGTGSPFYVKTYCAFTIN